MNAQKPAAARATSVAFSVILRGALPPTVVVGLVTALVIGLISGPRAGICALIGVAIAVAFFASGLVTVSRIVRDTSNPMLFMAVGMSVYFAQIIILLGVLVLARQIESFDSRSAGIAMLVSVLVWQAAQMRAWRQARLPVYDDVSLDPGADAPPAGEAR